MSADRCYVGETGFYVGLVPAPGFWQLIAPSGAYGAYSFETGRLVSGQRVGDKAIQEAALVLAQDLAAARAAAEATS